MKHRAVIVRLRQQCSARRAPANLRSPLAGGIVGFAVGLALVFAASAAVAADLPPVSELKPVAELPDPLLLFGGGRVETREQWVGRRRPELIRLFQHYMYGRPPAAPKSVEAVVERVDTGYFGGKATKQEVTISFGPPGTPKISLLLVVPNKPAGPKPVFLGINFCGNHTLLDDPSIAISKAWMPERCPGCVDNRATEAGRGKEKDVWAVEQTIDRGYALACFYSGDVDPDRNDFSDGVHPFYDAPGQAERDPHAWGTIAAWAWGMQRAVDLVALCAPRPVLFSNAQEDTWADPEGQFRVLQGADPVYRLLGSTGLGGASLPEPDRLLSSPLGYYIRPGKHSMTTGDWKVFLDFADANFRAK
ncbi:MAG: hypothetical protein HY290_03420 [Planctomycetia bacterium]|nr:hypothetical protein [Planctomycetia bacterium]